MEIAIILALITIMIAIAASVVGKSLVKATMEPSVLITQERPSGLPELRKLSNKLTETEAELSAFFHLAPIMFFITGTNGYFLKINPEVIKEFGWTSEEFTSLPYLDFVHPEDVEKTAGAAKDMAEQKLKNFENRYRCKNGSYKTVSWLTSVFFRNKAFCVAAIVINKGEFL